MIRTKNIIHPGEILLEEFLKPMGLSQNRLSIDIRVPAPRINAIIKEKRSISADTALLLGVRLGTGPEFWANLQSNYDLCRAANAAKKELSTIPRFALAT